MTTTSAANVIVAGARTPMGRLLGSLKDFSAADLGTIGIWIGFSVAVATFATLLVWRFARLSRHADLPSVA